MNLHDVDWSLIPVPVDDGATLTRRLTLIIDDAVITKVFYPVFPPDQNAAAVIEWLKSG